MKHIFWTADETWNRRKILAVSTQLKQLQKESLSCLSCTVTAKIFLQFDLSSAVQNICFIYLQLLQELKSMTNKIGGNELI